MIPGIYSAKTNYIGDVPVTYVIGCGNNSRQPMTRACRRCRDDDGLFRVSAATATATAVAVASNVNG